MNSSFYQCNLFSFHKVVAAIARLLHFRTHVTLVVVFLSYLNSLGLRYVFLGFGLHVLYICPNKEVLEIFTLSFEAVSWLFFSFHYNVSKVAACFG